MQVLSSPGAFKRLLAHFALHVLPMQALATAAPAKLSTEADHVGSQVVDNSGPTTAVAPLLGWVLPKRLARRAVTRQLLKRQVRSCAAAHEAQMHGRAWLLRQRSAFDLKQFPSAASVPLRLAVRGELQALWQQALLRCRKA
jgi:ribonuclease P protein component